MATDATGTPTPKGIPKYDTANDAPSGLGFNAAMDAIDTLLGWVKLRKNSAGPVLSRSRLNLIEGSNITITVADDSTDNEVDVTIAANVPASTLPAGVIAAYGGAAAPTGWLLCDGSAVSRTTYADLFTAIGTAYGAGDGSTTFNLPDMRGRVPVGKGTHADVDALGDNEGAAVSSRRTKHWHGVSAPAGTQVGGGGGSSHLSRTAQFTDYGPLEVGPKSNTVEDTPAYLVHNFIIKT